MSSGTPIVFVVDDDASVLRGLKRLLRSAGFTAETFASAPEFLELYDRNAAGCVILDLAMPAFDGLQMQKALADRGSVLPIIFLTGHGDIATSVQAMKGGAIDFLPKPFREQTMLDAVARAVEVSQTHQRWRQRQDEAREVLERLSPRELEVARHLALGQSNKEVARALDISHDTVKLHVRHIMDKLNLRSRVEAAVFAFEYRNSPEGIRAPDAAIARKKPER